MRIAAHRRRRSGSSIFEATLFVPILAMLLYGSLEMARITWTYYTLQKMMYTIARYAGTQVGANFCDDTDPVLTDAKTLALRGIGETTGDPLLPSLTADQIQIRIERLDADTQGLGECECSVTGCDLAQGGRGPDYIIVSIPDGYSVRTNIPFVPSETFVLRPLVKVPHGSL
jgi:hypothetical protein